MFIVIYRIVILTIFAATTPTQGQPSTKITQIVDKEPISAHRLQSLTNNVQKWGVNHPDLDSFSREIADLEDVDFDNLTKVEDLARLSINMALQRATYLMKESALVIFAGGEATRLSKGLGVKTAKALIGMRTGTVQKKHSLTDPTFLDWHILQSIWASEYLKADQILPLVFYTSDATHQEIVEYLKKSEWRKRHPNILVANIQRFAPVFNQTTKTALPAEHIRQIGFGHGEIFDALARPSVSLWLAKHGVKRIMTSNIEGALGYSPLAFSTHFQRPDAVYTAFLVETSQSDQAGGFLRKVRPRGALVPYRLSIVEVVEEGKKPLPRGRLFSTNSAIFELEPLLSLAERHPPEIAVEEKEQTLKDGSVMKILRGKTGQSAIIDRFPTSSNAEFVIVARHLAYATMKDLDEIRISGHTALESTLDLQRQIQSIAPSSSDTFCSIELWSNL